VFWMNSMNWNSLNRSSTAHITDILTFHVSYPSIYYCPLFKIIQLPVQRGGSPLAHATTVWGENIQILSKQGFLFLHDLFHWSLFVRRFAYLLLLPFLHLIRQSFDLLAAFLLELLQAILFISV
jgi:hypothetical protein